MKRHTGPVWMLWHGGSSYTAPSVEDVEELTSTVDVMDVLLDRFFNRDGSTPCVDESSSAQVFYRDPRDEDDPYPDELVTWSHYHQTYRRDVA